MIQEIIEYKNILDSMEDLINNSPFKKGHIIKESGLTAPTFYRKLKNKTFSPDEAISIIKVISPKEAYRQELLDGIAQGREDIKNGNTFTSEEVREMMREKIEAYQ